MIEKHIKLLSNLRTDHNRKRWTPLTCHRAPHKPFLLLSIMDLVAQGRIETNFIEPSFELVETWNGYWHAVMPVGKASSMAYPFPRLRSDGFWTLVCNPGFDSENDYNVTTMIQCRRIYAGARLDEDLIALLLDTGTRDRLRAVLIDTYFAPEIRPVMFNQGVVNYGAEVYRRKILSEARENLAAFGAKCEGEEKIRDQGFRKAIVSLYEHRCALCGIRMLTPEGHTVVEAAHIIPWSESQDDQPTNGLCLCRICHWSFDEGMMSVGRRYEVLVSNRARSDRNLPGHILTMSAREIIRPEEKRFWPDQDNLSWHRKARFVS